uniref:Uncharacterized protein n=1 Tax=Oryza sativa subsp. japonica TaxID=39947 RepID=Q8H5U6_ORYSJ|nr:hypothetical protein [Oryza sativa Japonica Group]
MAPEWSSSSSEPAVERSDSCGYWSSCRVSSHGHHHEAAEDDDPSEREGGSEGAASPRSPAAVSWFLLFFRIELTRKRYVGATSVEDRVKLAT